MNTTFKKALSLALCLVLCLCFAGCSSTTAELDRESVSLKELSETSFGAATAADGKWVYALGSAFNPNGDVGYKVTAATIYCEDAYPTVGGNVALYYCDALTNTVVEVASKSTDDSFKVGAWKFTGNGSGTWAVSENDNGWKYTPADRLRMLDVAGAAQVGHHSNGGQWTVAMEADPQGTGLMFMSGDMTGIYRSTDFGKSWTQSNVGFEALSANDIAVDPKNPNHVIATGLTSNYTATKGPTGLYLSMNGGRYWEQVANQYVGDGCDCRNKIVFDPTSYDASYGYCLVAYWSQENITTTSGAQVDGSNGKLWKTTDGGRTWNVVSVSGVSDNGNDLELLCTDNGVLFGFKVPRAGVNDATINTENKTLYKSTNDGQTWTSVSTRAGSFRWATVLGNTLYVSTSSGFDKGTVDASGNVSWSKLTTDSNARNLQYIAVSNDGNYISAQGNSKNNWRYSSNGGTSWTPADVSKLSRGTGEYNAFQPRNERRSDRAYAGYHNGQHIFVALDGDSIARSTNGGQTWYPQNYGYDVPCTEKIEFNVSNPNLVFMPNQDYYGAGSTDAGRTWKNGVWWEDSGWFSNGDQYTSHTYGGYMINETTIVTVCTEEDQDHGEITGTDWNRNIRYSTNFGEDFTETRYNVAYAADFESLGTLDNSYVFVGNYRAPTTETKLDSWSEMTTTNGNKIYGVWCIDYNTGRLYGRTNNYRFAYSDDNGASWTEFADYSAYTQGVAESNSYNHILKSMSCDKDGNIYFSILDGYGSVYYGKTKVTENEVTSLAVSWDNKVGYNHRDGAYVVDFYNPEIQYIAVGRENKWDDATQTDDTIYRNDSIFRSIDGGQNWYTLDKCTWNGNPYTLEEGAGDYYNIVINYAKDEVWFIGWCTGIAVIDRVEPADFY